MQLAFTLLLVFFNSHGPSHHPPASCPFVCLPEACAGTQRGSGNQASWIAYRFWLPGNLCVRGPACMNARLWMCSCLEKYTCVRLPGSTQPSIRFSVYFLCLLGDMCVLRVYLYEIVIGGADVSLCSVSSVIRVGVCIWVCSALCVPPAEPIFARLWRHRSVCACE